MEESFIKLYEFWVCFSFTIYHIFFDFGIGNHPTPKDLPAFLFHLFYCTSVFFGDWFNNTSEVLVPDFTVPVSADHLTFNVLDKDLIGASLIVRISIPLSIRFHSDLSAQSS